MLSGTVQGCMSAARNENASMAARMVWWRPVPGGVSREMDEALDEEVPDGMRGPP